MVKRVLRILLYVIAGLLLCVVLFGLFVIAPVDRTPIRQMPEYGQMMQRLDSLPDHVRSSERMIRVGFAKLNLTPDFVTATAGYGKRKGAPYEKVLDSIFVRAVVFDNGVSRAALVSADLLIIPPTVVEKLNQKLAVVGFSLNNTYLTATHTHNSMGEWGEGATRFLYGAYNEELVEHIADKIVSVVGMAALDLKPAKIRIGKVAVPELVKNRIDAALPEDPFARLIEIDRGEKLLLVSYTAHATCLYAKDLSLSRDYAGALVDSLERSTVDFAMFLAGPVGSHGCDVPAFGEPCIGYMADHLETKINETLPVLAPLAGSELQMLRVPLALPDAQVKISPDWKLRGWVFQWAFGSYPAHVTALQIGDLVLLGTPADMSGEFSAHIDSVANVHQLSAMVTSFNGGYIGYLTPEMYYDSIHYETQLMNWYPPGTGSYVRDSFEKLLEKLHHE